MTLLKSKAAAAYLGVHENTLKRWSIPHVVLNSRGDRRYDTAILDAFLEARAQGAGTSPMSWAARRSAPAKAATKEASSSGTKTIQSEAMANEAYFMLRELRVVGHAYSPWLIEAVDFAEILDRLASLLATYEER